MKYYVLILAFISTFICCTTTNVDETLLSISEISLTWKGQTQLTYEADTYQLGYNDIRNEYRVYDDRLSYWFILSCSESPSQIGQTLTADVTWTGKSSTKTFKKLQFTVKKTDESGLIWLWNQSEKIGIIIKRL